MSGSSYTRTHGAAQAGRDSTFPRFHIEPVEDPVSSAAAGRPIFISQERVQIIQPGNPNQPVLLVDDEHRKRWPEHYARFLAGQDASADGTPLEQWPVLSRAMVLEMKAMGLHTVEQCAGLSDLAVQQIKMGGQRIRQLAKAYLDEAEQMAITTAALDRAEKAESRVATLEQQVSELRPMLDRMHGELMAMKNAPSQIDSYVPGAHDPLQPGSAVAAHAPVASSLEALGALRTPRQRQKEAA